MKEGNTISEGDCLQLPCLAMCISLSCIDTHVGCMKGRVGIWKVLFCVDQLRSAASHEGSRILYDFFGLFLSCYTVFRSGTVHTVGVTSQ
jgi:hypothetical protein